MKTLDWILKQVVALCAELFFERNRLTLSDMHRRGDIVSDPQGRKCIVLYRVKTDCVKITEFNRQSIHCEHIVGIVPESK